MRSVARLALALSMAAACSFYSPGGDGAPSGVGETGSGDDEGGPGTSPAMETGAAGTTEGPTPSDASGGPGSSSDAGGSSTGEPSVFAQCRRLSIADPPAEVLENVPVLVRLLDDPARFDYDLAAPEGADLRFFEDGTLAPLAHEIERWTDHGESIAWVRVPQLGGGAQQLWMCFGHPAPPAADDPSAVWEGTYAGVWHLEIDRSGKVLDSTSNTMTGQLGGGATLDAVGPGFIGLGLTFDAPGSQVTVPHRGTLDLVDAVTIEGWVRLDAIVDDLGRFLVRKRSSYFLHVLRDWTSEPFMYVYSAANPYAISAGGVLPVDQWVHLAGTFDRATGVIRIFVEGDLVGEYDYSFAGDLPIDVGVYPLDLGHELNGSFDEVRLAPVAHSPAWIEVQARSGADALLQFGPAEPDPGAG